MPKEYPGARNLTQFPAAPSSYVAVKTPQQAADERTVNNS